MGCVSETAMKDAVKIPHSQKIDKVEKYKSNVLGEKEMEIFIRWILPKILKNLATDAYKFELVYQASRFLFSAREFHKASNGIENTVFIAKSDNGSIFGGFTPCKWEDDVMYKYAKDDEKKSFLFRICTEQKKQKEEAVEFFELIQSSKAILNNVQDGPVFGSGRDIHISDKCDGNECWANLGQSYQSPHKFGSNKANSLLGGEIKFKISEYELWRIIIKK